MKLWRMIMRKLVWKGFDHDYGVQFKQYIFGNNYVKFLFAYFKSLYGLLHTFGMQWCKKASFFIQIQNRASKPNRPYIILKAEVVSFNLILVRTDLVSLLKGCDCSEFGAGMGDFSNEIEKNGSISWLKLDLQQYFWSKQPHFALQSWLKKY